MASQNVLIFREEIMPADKVLIKEGASAPSCPYCGHQDLVIRGTVGQYYQETVKAGNVVESTKLDPSTLEFEISSFDCCRCFIRFIVKSEAEIEMFNVIQYLQNQLGAPESC